MIRNALLGDNKAIHEISKLLGYKSVDESITKEKLILKTFMSICLIK